MARAQYEARNPRASGTFSVVRLIGFAVKWMSPVQSYKYRQSQQLKVQWILNREMARSPNYSIFFVPDEILPFVHSRRDSHVKESHHHFFRRLVAPGHRFLRIRIVRIVL